MKGQFFYCAKSDHTLLFYENILDTPTYKTKAEPRK